MSKSGTFNELETDVTLQLERGTCDALLAMLSEWVPNYKEHKKW